MASEWIDGATQTPEEDGWYWVRMHYDEPADLPRLVAEFRNGCWFGMNGFRFGTHLNPIAAWMTERPCARRLAEVRLRDRLTPEFLHTLYLAARTFGRLDESPQHETILFIGRLYELAKAPMPDGIRSMFASEDDINEAFSTEPLEF